MLQDLRFALRQLLKNPGFTAVAVLTLALGIGINTSMFGALQTLLARRLTYPRPEGLVQVFQTSPHSPWGSHHSAPNIADYRQSGAFALLAAFTDKSFNLSFPGEAPERVRGLMVSPDLFPMLGVPPQLGRWFSAGEEAPGHAGVVILDHAFWQQRFAGDPGVVGETLRLDGEPVTVVGVMPESFHDPMLMGAVSIWKPLVIAEPERSNRGHSYLKCIARLAPGQALNDGQAAANGLAARQRGEHPQASPDGLRLVPLAESSLPPQARQMVWLVMVLAGFVLLIACANLANLQCARTLTRGRELAIRGALGASQGRLLGQLLGESVLLAALGGGVGVVL
ncbi:MAG: ABC transporter permease, partial [Verrucomicrobia bacterium]|nr:ABC transporter permease [Verrucomicrobiota bacterium]